MPSEWIPAAASVEWEGPAGHATLSAHDAFGPWRVVSEADVEAGRSALPFALLPAGRGWTWVVEVDTGRRKLRSREQVFTLPPPPADAGDPVVVSVDRGRAQSTTGFWVGYHYGNKLTPEASVPVILDGTGQIVWWIEPRDDGIRPIRVRPSHDGRSILVLADHEDPELRFVERWALDGRTRTETRVTDASHDFWENDDGTFTFFAYDYSTDEIMPETRPPTVTERIRTVPEGSHDYGDAVDGFDFFDDYPGDPWYPCSHAEYDLFVPDASEWTHANSLIRSPYDDGWLVTARFIDALVAVDDAGAFQWQAGGRYGTLEREDPGAEFEHGHSSDAWAEYDGIHLLMFDNGDHSPAPIVSRVVELVLDAPHGVYRSVWSLDDPQHDFVTFLGDAQRLPNGNTLVVWTDRGELGEYGPDGDEVRLVDVVGQLGRGVWVPSLHP